MVRSANRWCAPFFPPPLRRAAKLNALTNDVVDSQHVPYVNDLPARDQSIRRQGFAEHRRLGEGRLDPGERAARVDGGAPNFAALSHATSLTLSTSSQWYCHFFLGRRSFDDQRQISRWNGCAGPRGRFKTSLVKKIAQAGGVDHLHDDEVAPILRQTLLHWAVELTQESFEAYLA